MNAAEWMPEEAAIRHIARACNFSYELARQELAYRAAEGFIAVVDQEESPIEPDRVMDFKGEVFYSRVDLEREFPLPGATKAEPPTPEEQPKHTRKGLGGPTTRYEWDIIVREVFRRVRENGPPKKNFAGEIFEWCELELGIGRAPDVETLRKHIGFWLGTRKALK